MESTSITSTPCSILQDNSVPVFENAIHVSLPSEDFSHIAIQANAAADSLLHAADVDFSRGHRSKPSSIGILDLDKEGDAFSLESEGSLFGFDCLSEPEMKPWRDPPKSVDNEGIDGGRPDWTPGSIDVRVLSLELQGALKGAELEVTELQAQVVSKTQHLEMAQKALVEYEDEVQTLRRQLRELAEGSDRYHVRRLSRDDFVRDLCRVTSGTHRIRQSLEDGDGSAMFKKQHLETLKENCEQLNLENAKLNDENMKLKGSCERLSNDNRSLISENAILKERVENGISSGSTSNAESNHLESLEEEIRSLNNEKTKLKKQLLQAQEELMCVLAETPDADEEVATYRRRLKEAQEERDVYRRDLDCAKTELMMFKSQLVDVKRSAVTEQGSSEDEHVLQLREDLNAKLMERPDILQRDESVSSDRENLDAKERISTLQEALSLALEAKHLLEQKITNCPVPFDSLKGLLEDIASLKESFQLERRIALRERTENENLIVNLQQERDALLVQMDRITSGLHGLEEETSRLQGQLAQRKQSADDFRTEADAVIRKLEIDNASLKHKLAQVREALDLCLEAKRELEIRAQQSDVVLREWTRCFGHATMDADEDFTVALRRRVESNDIDRVRQAALQAIEHLERLRDETQRCMEWTAASVEAQCDTPRSSVESQDGNRMVTVTSNQLRMLRRDLREVSQQRDDAMQLLKRQKETDARRFGEIQELQGELNAALDQYEQLLPKFHDVINGKRELESLVQSLQHELDREGVVRKETEEAVMGLLDSCRHVLKSPEGGALLKKQSLIDAVVSMKMELDAYVRSIGKRSVGFLQPSSSRHSEESSASHRASDLRPLTDQLRSMVDKERDLRRYFESQTERLAKLKVDTEQRSRWIKRTQSGLASQSTDDRPASEMQIQERNMTMQKLQMKDEEISELLNELGRIPSMDEETTRVLKGLGGIAHRGQSISHPATQELGARLSRLQECAGALEEQLMNVKSENRELKNERQMLLERIQSHL